MLGMKGRCPTGGHKFHIVFSFKIISEKFLNEIRCSGGANTLNRRVVLANLSYPTPAGGVYISWGSDNPFSLNAPSCWASRPEVATKLAKSRTGRPQVRQSPSIRAARLTAGPMTGVGPRLRRACQGHGRVRQRRLRLPGTMPRRRTLATGKAFVSGRHSRSSRSSHG